MLKAQERIQEMVPGFRFNLGFSGKYFHHGTTEENLGDDMILGTRQRLLVIKLSAVLLGGFLYFGFVIF